MKRIASFLALAGVGATTVAGAVAWDALRHARGTATHGDSVMGLDDPAHVLLAVGLVLTSASVGGAAHALLRLYGPTDRVRTWGPRIVLASALTLAGVVGAAVGWAETTGQPAHHHDDGLVETAIHEHEDEAHHPLDHGSSADATPEQQTAAQRLFEDTKRGIARFEDVAVARADGYVPVTPETIPLVHYLNRAYVENGRVLEPERPESLVYLHTPGGALLLGAMFVMPVPGMPGPRIGGPITHWHTHTNLCFTGEWQVVAFTDADGGCPEGSARVETPEMLHVWTVDNPDGPFAHDIDPATLLRVAAEQM